MNNAELYQQSNRLQKRDALQTLEEYVMKIKWKKNGDRVIDIGCGDGSVTIDILRAYMPTNYKMLMGCDVSSNMIKFANNHHGNKRNEFRVLDIESDLPQDLKQGFDHAFSFYTLHWIKDQHTAFSNIYDLLADRGDCLLVFLGHMPVYDVYRLLARSSKWSQWLKDVDRFVSPYHDVQEPEKEIKRMMVQIGFKFVEVQCREKCYIYDSVETLKKAVKAVNPFKIPEDLYEEFLEDYVEIVRGMRLMDKRNNNLEEAVNIRTSYSLIIAYGRKIE